MDYRRNFQPGGTFFFTLVTYQRRPIFNDEPSIQLLQSVIRDVKSIHPFTIQAWVILPDHLHMIWTLPFGDSDFSNRWSRIKSTFTRHWFKQGGKENHITDGKRRDRRRGVWQNRFMEHTIRDENDFETHVQYIHYNPVKHAHCNYPKDWQYSSFTEYVKRGDYPDNWCCGNKTGKHIEDRLTYSKLE